MKQKLLLVVLMIFSLNTLFAQKEDYVKRMQSKSSTEISNYYQKVHSRTPAPEQLKMLQQRAAPQHLPKNSMSKGMQMPEKMWFPGEFEEVQAIYITFPYVAFFRSNPDIFASPLFPHVGYATIEGEDYIDSIDYVLDTFETQTRMPFIFAELINGIQKEAQAWINIWDLNDSTILKEFMERKGMPLTNYRFFCSPGNSIWYRDCGPVAFYYGDNDDIGFLDFEYYGGRPADDVLPITLGNETGYPVYTTPIEFEGGNLLIDGAQTLFTSSALYPANMDTYGQYFVMDTATLTIGYYIKNALSKAAINDSMMNLMNLKKLVVLPTLVNDGGTGHIDLYADMWDEEHFVFSKYPESMSSHRDYTIAAKNIDSISSTYSVHESLYKRNFVPFPKKDNNNWYTSESDYKKYTRTYSNHTFVNKLILQPTFSNEKWGSIDWDKAALDTIKMQYPGYEVIPVDVRGYQNRNYTGFDGMGGAIHCVTKQIPAENPIRILHKSIEGLYSNQKTDYPITATITNRSGIASASCYWREKGATTWNTVSLTAGENNQFSGTIHRNAVTSNDTIEYYISATSNNGKTITKPITAPKGFYMNYGYGIGVETVSTSKTVHLGEFYPNPAKEVAKIEIQNNNNKPLKVELVNINGQVVYTTNIGKADNHVIFEMKTNSFAEGLYNVVFSTKDGERTTKKLMILK